jgi:hypothetical protein
VPLKKQIVIVTTRSKNRGGSMARRRALFVGVDGMLRAICSRLRGTIRLILTGAGAKKSRLARADGFCRGNETWTRLERLLDSCEVAGCAHRAAAARRASSERIRVGGASIRPIPLKSRARCYSHVNARARFYVGIRKLARVCLVKGVVVRLREKRFHFFVC